MSHLDTLLLLAKSLASCTEGVTAPERITIQYGAIEAAEFLYQRGLNSVSDAKRHGLTMLGVWRGERVTTRDAFLYEIGFSGMLLMGGALVWEGS